MDGWKQASKQAAKQETTPQQVVQLPSVVEAVQRNSPKFQTLLSCVCLVCLCVCVCVCVCVCIGLLVFIFSCCIPCVCVRVE